MNLLKTKRVRPASFAALVCIFTLVLSPLTQASDLKFETNYSPGNIDFPGTNAVFHISEFTPLFKSDLLTYEGAQNSQIACRSTQDPDCGFGANDGISRSILPPCADATSTNCIDGLQISLQDNIGVRAKLVKEMGGYVIPADPAKGYIGGRSASIWALDSNKPASTLTPETFFLVVANLEVGWDSSNSTFNAPHKISVSVFPFVENPGDFSADRWATDLEREMSVNSQFQGIPLKFVPKVRQGASANDLRNCLFFDDKYCGLLTNFQENTKVKVDLRLTSDLGGWFHGRIKDPIITIESITPTSNLISVEAQAIKIPRLVHVVDYYAMPALEKTLFDQTFFSGAAPRELLAGPLADEGETAFRFLNSLREKVEDSAAGFTSVWNFSSIKSGNGSECLNKKGKVLGIVSTNATAFESTAPKFLDGQLEYKVAGLHYGPDKKTENLGTYDLVINSEVARCLYGFTNAPISASVSITGGSDQKIATTVVNEKNGWLKLAAYGFTYSEKTLQVKLTQEPEVVVTPTPTPTPSASTKTVAKKITITCVKGKTSKKVTAVKPKCPTGYKKK